ncbi:MAG: hypothetical protein ACRDSL_09990 [Pseudonocardiaceae bacterium]
MRSCIGLRCRPGGAPRAAPGLTRNHPGLRQLPVVEGRGVARHHHAVLVHYDRDFDDITKVASDVSARWITPSQR